MKALYLRGRQGQGARPSTFRPTWPTRRRSRETMVEDIAECDEDLMDKYLESGELTPEELKQVCERRVVSGTWSRDLRFGQAISASPRSGHYSPTMPSPVDRGAVKGKKPGRVPEERNPDEKAPFSALVFKTIADPYAGRLTLFRVFSGTVSSDSTFFNATARPRSASATSSTSKVRARNRPRRSFPAISPPCQS